MRYLRSARLERVFAASLIAALALSACTPVPAATTVQAAPAAQAATAAPAPTSTDDSARRSATATPAPAPTTGPADSGDGDGEPAPPSIGADNLPGTPIYNAPIIAYDVNADQISFPDGKNVDYCRVHDKVVKISPGANGGGTVTLKLTIGFSFAKPIFT